MALTIDGSDPTGDLGDLLDAKLNVAGGKILQIVSTLKSDTFTLGPNTSFTEVTGLTATITPSSATSKVLVLVSVSGQRNNANTGVGQFTVFKNGANLIVPTSPGSRNPSFVSGVQMGDTNGGSNMESYAFTYLDSPASTSAQTYAVRVRNGGGTETNYVNRTETDTDNAAIGRGVSSIIVMEVSA
jgi:hypothetical protein